MSVPKSRKTSSRTKRGRSHDALKPVQLFDCPKCKASIVSHRACPNCGFYKGREVFKSRTDKKAAQLLKKEQTAKAEKAKA